MGLAVERAERRNNKQNNNNNNLNNKTHSKKHKKNVDNSAPGPGELMARRARAP